MQKKVIRILLLLILVTFLGYLAKRQGFVLGTRADVVGNLFFTYPGGPTPETLFNEGDFKPGDCKTASVNVKNNGVASAIVGVFSDGEEESDGLSSALNIEISDDSSTLYGPVSLAQFFADSNILNEIELLTLAGGAEANLHFEVCFPDTDDNELQGDQVVFDLKFGQITPPIELPDECDELEGIVTEIVTGGTPGNDFITGSSASELIEGFGGNDWIWGGGGHDCIIAGPGKDRVSGGTGNDIVVAGEGEDRIDGGTGNDKVLGGSGNDRISGGSGEDDLFGEAGNDRLSGGSQNDFLDGGPDTDSLSGGSGTDTCVDGETLTSCEL